MRRWPVLLEVRRPGPTADRLIDGVVREVGAERDEDWSSDASGTLRLLVPAAGPLAASRRAERALSAQGFGWSDHLAVVRGVPGDRPVPTVVPDDAGALHVPPAAA